nr:PilZ domain-containing protein [uncultured Roseibium sp.]
MPDTENAAQSPSDEFDTEQNERARRSRALKKGKLIFNRGLRSIPCIVRNLSESGAKLEFEQAYLLPQEFVLQIDLEDFEVTCQRRWEDGLRCGVEFISGKRAVGQMRSQTLKSSDDALTEEIDELRDSPDNYFSRKRVLEQQRPNEPEGPARATRPDASSTKGFGRRR